MNIYQVATVSYDPNNNEFPWYTVRFGEIAEQGGLGVGSSTASFKTIQEVFTFLSLNIERDEQLIKDIVDKKENEKDLVD